MSNTITILGCGYLGAALASRCLSEGLSVSALTRNIDTAKSLDQLGVSKVVVSNLEDDSWHGELNPEQDHVVNCVGASSPDLDGYVASYVEGQQSAMKWLSQGKASNYLFTSSCSVYPQNGRKLVDETASCSGVAERGGLLLAAEQVSFPPPSTIGRSFILRLAGIYGPDRHLLLEKVKSGTNLEGNADRILNLIHRDDAVDAILACLQANTSNLGRIYNVSDGNHAPRGQIVTWLAEKLGVDNPGFAEDDEESTPNRKISTNRILDELGWSPRYPTFMDGYSEII